MSCINLERSESTPKMTLTDLKHGRTGGTWDSILTNAKFCTSARGGKGLSRNTNCTGMSQKKLTGHQMHPGTLMSAASPLRPTEPSACFKEGWRLTPCLSRNEFTKHSLDLFWSIHAQSGTPKPARTSQDWRWSSVDQPGGSPMITIKPQALEPRWPRWAGHHSRQDGKGHNYHTSSTSTTIWYPLTAKSSHPWSPSTEVLEDKKKKKKTTEHTPTFQTWLSTGTTYLRKWRLLQL